MPPSRGLTYEKPNIESYVPTFFNNCTANASIMRKPQQNSFPLKCNIQNYFLIVIWIIIFFVPLYWEWVIIFGDVSHLLPHITNLWQPNIYIGNVYYSNIFIGNVYCSNIVKVLGPTHELILKDFTYAGWNKNQLSWTFPRRR